MSICLTRLASRATALSSLRPAHLNAGDGGRRFPSHCRALRRQVHHLNTAEKSVLIFVSAHLAAVVGLGMLPIMDSIHRQNKAYTDMKVRGSGYCSHAALSSSIPQKPQNIALDAQGKPFLIDVGQLANQVCGLCVAELDSVARLSARIFDAPYGHRTSRTKVTPPTLRDRLEASSERSTGSRCASKHVRAHHVSTCCKTQRKICFVQQKCAHPNLFAQTRHFSPPLSPLPCITSRLTLPCQCLQVKGCTLVMTLSLYCGCLLTLCGEEAIAYGSG
jgi:hypothetical protein